METKVITIPEKMRDYVESLHYETNARASLVKFMVESELTDKPGFKKIYDEYIEYMTQYEMAKDELESIYLRPEMTGKFSWSFDFRTSEVTCIAQG